MVPFNVAYLGEGRFHKGVAGDCTPRTGRETRALAKRVGGGPGALRLSDDMLGLAWGKLLINLNNAVSALSGRTLVEELRERDYRRVVAASQREGLRLLRQRGHPAGESRPGAAAAAAADASARPIGCSTTCSSSAGRSTPRRARRWPTISSMAARPRSTMLNGELVRLAGGWAARAPVNREIVELVRKAEAGARRGAPPRYVARCLAASGRRSVVSSSPAPGVRSARLGPE